MLVSFTQTYGTGREELIDIHFRDKRLIDLKNHFDLNIYSFHNCEQETINKFKELNKDVIKNVVILEYTDKYYPETVKKFKAYLKEVGCTYFFFSQDDTFSKEENKDINWEELIEYVKGYDKDFMLSLYNTDAILDIDNPIEEKVTFNVLKSTTSDFYNSDKTPWSMDDTPYICTIDMLDEIYDEKYFTFENIWDAELYLMDKYDKKCINRFVTDKSIFRNYNLFGKSIGMKVIFRKILKRNGLL